MWPWAAGSSAVIEREVGRGCGGSGFGTRLDCGFGRELLCRCVLWGIGRTIFRPLFLVWLGFMGEDLGTDAFSVPAADTYVSETQREFFEAYV